MSWFEEVKAIWGECKRSQASVLLWHCTPFPFVDAEEVFEQLKKIKEKSGGNFDKAIEIIEKEIDEAMKTIPERR